jgi:hypothetical protein
MDWRERELFNVVEHEDQKKIVRCLREEFNCIVFDLDIMSTLSFINNEQDKMRFISEHKARGYTNGQPDIVIITPKGKVIFVELKTKNGQQSENQKKMEDKLSQYGQVYRLWRSVDDCLSFLNMLDK